MAEDDYTDVLEGTVDEVKEAIRDMDEPDFEALLEAEKEGKDRKTVREFIESKIPSEEEEASEEDEASDLEEDEEEEIVEEIEEETSGGILGSYSGTSLLAGGVILGIVIGFVVAGFTGVSDDVTGNTADPQLVRDSVQTIAGVGLNSTPDVSEPEVKHSMYNMNVTTEVETENETMDQSQEVYVTLDGEKLFIVQEQFGQTLMPLDVQQAVRQAEAAEQQEDLPEEDPTANESDSVEVPDDVNESVTVE